MKNNLRSARGSALINAIIVAGVVAGIAGIIMSQTRTTDKMSRNPRIKSAMTVLETQMLSMAMQPGIYQGCSSQAQNCQLNQNAVAAFQRMARNVTGADCHPSSPAGAGGSNGTTPSSCGVVVREPSTLACLNNKNPGYNANCAAGQFYNPGTQTFCAEIVYQGTELAMQPTCASTTVPQSVLQGDASSCATLANLAGPYPKVIFRGYDAAGNAVCSPIPSCSGGNISLAGNYLTAIDKISMQTQCKTLGAGNLACPAGTVLSNLQWLNVGTSFGPVTPTANCVARRAPADNHQVQAFPPVTVPPGTYVVTTTLPAGPPPPPPPTPTTMALTAWNCRDGAVCGSRTTGIIDEPTSGISPNNPGSAWIMITLNVVNGTYSFRCQCSSGTLTKTGCDGGTGDAEWTCVGGSTAVPNCSWNAANPSATGGPGPYCVYGASLGPNGGWGCRTSVAGPPTILYPCP